MAKRDSTGEATQALPINTAAFNGATLRLNGAVAILRALSIFESSIGDDQDGPSRSMKSEALYGVTLMLEDATSQIQTSVRINGGAA